MAEEKNKYNIIEHNKSNDVIKEYEEQINNNVVRALGWLSLSSVGMIGLAVASTKEESIMKLILGGALVLSLSTPGIIASISAHNLKKEMNTNILKTLRKEKMY